MATTIPTVITYSGDVPNRTQQPAVWNVNMNSLISYYTTFQTSYNASVSAMNTAIGEAEGFATSASESAVAAANSASSASDFRDEAEGFKNDSQTILDSNTAIAAAVQSAAGLPSLTGNAGLALVVNETEDGVLWDNAGGERLTFTKSFNAGEEASYTLDGDGLIPVVSVAKEVPQIGETNNQWGVGVGGYEQAGSDLNISSAVEIRADGFKLSGASYDSLSLGISSEDGSPNGIFINSSGTKMYMIGTDSDAVHQYTLSTAGDISTATYDSVFFSVSSQVAVAFDMHFTSDMSKMYVLDNTGATIYQYTLSTAGDISTATYDSVFFSASAQNTNMQSFSVSDDGAKLYMLGGYKIIYQYTLSTAGDISTATYDSVNIDVGSVSGNNTTAIDIVAGGTKMYVYGAGPNTIYQYTLSTAGDISTATYDSVFFSVASQSTAMQDLCFSSDGVSMYVVSTTSDTIYQYSTGLISLLNQYIPAITNTSGQINTTFWTDINSMTANETLNSQTINYALSNDDRTTWQIGLTGNSPRNIVRNNGGTWEYNSDATYASETWTAATTNTEYDALSEAMAVAVNQMNSTQLQALADAEQIVLGNELDLAVILYTNDSSVTPVFSGMTIDYDANIANEPAILGTDYEWKSYGTSDITIKALTANNLKGRVL